jgi:peptidyl-prolyl cis-trans isomerase A (cyclophilin A)
MGFLRKVWLGFTSTTLIRVVALLSVSGLLMLDSAQAQNNTLVRVSTSYGDFTIELFDSQTPATVQNFLGYVDRKDFSGSVIHRLEPGFVVQGGAWRWAGNCVDGRVPPNCGPIMIPTQPAVINEPGISNTRGTLAMAKLGDDPNSATSQWFVNLADNSANLDQQNGGFTVFGRVMGDGMNAIDPIGQLTTYALSSLVQQIPLRDYDGFSGPDDKNLVHINMYRVQRFSSALHVFEHQSARLNTYVDTDQFGRLSLLMNLVEDGPDIIFEVDPIGIIPLAINPEGMATFNSGDQRLRIPTVEINNMGQLSVLKNVVMRLVDGPRLRFVVESFQE